MSKTTLSDSYSILKIHNMGQALMRHHYAHMQSLVRDLAPLLHERPSKVGDCYSLLDSSLRDNISTHQALDLALKNYETAFLQKNDESTGAILGGYRIPVRLPLIDYQALVQEQLNAYKLLKLQHFFIEYALSMMCLNYDLEEDSKATFCVRQLTEAFKAPEAFTRKTVWILTALEVILSGMLTLDEDRCVSGMALVVALTAQCQHLSLETKPVIPTPYGGKALRLERLKKAYEAYRSRADIDDTDNTLEGDPVF